MVFVTMFMFVFMVMVSATALMFIMVVMMLVVALVLFVVVVPMTATFVFLVVVVVFMTATFMLLMVMMVSMTTTMVVMLVFFKLVKLAFKSVRMFHCRKNSLAVQLVPMGGNYRRVVVMRLYKLNRSCKLFGARNVRMAENYARSGLNLVVEELAEVLHIHFAL